ncbi:hypothetical protein PGT21_021479 [Puccinia graminis f. sp. tritici]|uniref:Uncharacterized protein n=1 Tax=Puccinia graminis f. sp. tritici TaxID=56615 RepID=A0A5B0NCP2_PUCGR|nr:hypothetical protein PGT21_021479 [Puccinia graminis f. sp. tritici]
MASWALILILVRHCLGSESSIELSQLTHTEKALENASPSCLSQHHPNQAEVNFTRSPSSSHQIDIKIDHDDQHSFQRIPGTYTVQKPTDLAFCRAELNEGVVVISSTQPQTNEMTAALNIHNQLQHSMEIAEFENQLEIQNRRLRRRMSYLALLFVGFCVSLGLLIKIFILPITDALLHPNDYPYFAPAPGPL